MAATLAAECGKAARTRNIPLTILGIRVHLGTLNSGSYLVTGSLRRGSETSPARVALTAEEIK